MSRATQLVGDGALAATFADLDHAVDLFNEAGLCIFESVLPSDRVDECLSALSKRMRLLD